MYSVLIVDDEVMIKRSLRKLIDDSPFGFRVGGEAEDGSEALSVWEWMRPDLVITDISMPVMDGLELIRQIRSREQESEIVILSGYDDFGYAQQALRLGVMDCLLKPVREAQLADVLRKAAEKIAERRRSLTERGQRLRECKAWAAALAEELWLLREPEAERLAGGECSDGFRSKNCLLHSGAACSKTRSLLPKGSSSKRAAASCGRRRNRCSREGLLRTSLCFECGASWPITWNSFGKCATWASGTAFARRLNTSANISAVNSYRCSRWRRRSACRCRISAAASRKRSA